VTTVIPTGSDQEIRIYLAREEAAGTGEPPHLNEVTAEQIKEFRETQLPNIVIWPAAKRLKRCT